MNKEFFFYVVANSGTRTMSFFRMLDHEKVKISDIQGWSDEIAKQYNEKTAVITFFSRVELD